jgi:ubiquinone/menaquinone biosynthesis C-methylase UbiE
MSEHPHLRANIDRFSGFAEPYDRYRPTPPAIFLDIVTQLAQAEIPDLVIDLGSGTGLSTRIWSGRARQVIGIEPNSDMRQQAEQHTADPAIRYQSGHSTQTQLRDTCADIVTASQAFHWMEPDPTLAEVARILRPGGVFAAIDNDWPPAVHWEVEMAFMACLDRARALRDQYKLAPEVRHWPKDQHLSKIQSSQLFRYAREITLHSIEMGNTERLIGLALSQGGLATVLKAGISEDEAGLTALRETAQRVIGDQPKPWYFSYRVRLGIR